MKMQEINIRDPYILWTKGAYYLYGTRSETCWGPADGFDCYVSRDLEDWEGPTEIYHRPEGSPFDCCYWAPECYEIGGKYYFLTTLGASGQKKGIYMLVSDDPKGPFTMHSEGSLSPKDWSSIDGTLYFEDGKIFLIFSHSFEDVKDGDMCAVELSADLKRATGEPRLLFSAKDAPWAKPVPFAKAEFGIEGDCFFTDGPCAYRTKTGKLLILWSSWTEGGYGIGIAESQDGKLSGPWAHQEIPFYPRNGGHGMIFADETGTPYYLLHYPNDKTKERPVYRRLQDEGDTVRMEHQN